MKRLRQILVFLRPYRGPLILAAVLTGGLTLIGMAPPLLMRSLVNDMAREGRWGLFPLVMGLLFAVPVLRAIINIVNSIALDQVARGIIGETRKGLFARLMRLSMRFYDQTSAGAINQRLMGDVGTISGVAGGGLIALLGDVVMIIFAVVVMLRLSLPLSLLTFGLLPLYYLNTWFFSKRIQVANVQLRSRMDHISSMLQERLSAHELIQAYGQDKRESTHFSSQAKQIMDSAVRGQAYSITFNQLSAFINKIGNTLIYCGSCYFFVKGSMGYGDVIAFCAYATQLLGPIVRFSTVANQIAQVAVSIDRIDEIRNQEPAIREDPEAAPIEALHGDIRVEGVTFGYDPNNPVLRELSLDIPAGSHVAFVGSSGSGRTTLAMLLRRFYDPVDGKVEVDGKDVRRYRLQDYREALALVLPESTLFDGTIRENLCYGKPEAAEDRMIEVATAVGLHDFVQSLSDGYDARVGAGGLKLSVGVQQQIGIARALISEPFVLIVDEATAALDPDTAEMIHQAILQIMEGRTCILIVDRVLMARSSEHVGVLHEGRLAELGTHEELLRRSGSLYREIYGRQYGEDRLPPPKEGER